MKRRLAPALASVLVTTLGLSACKRDAPAAGGGDAPAAAAAPRPPEPDTPLPELRVGSLDPEPGRELAALVRARRVEADFRYFELELALVGDELGADWDRLHVELDGDLPGEIAAVASRSGDPALRLVLRRPVAAGEPALRGAIYGVRWEGGQRRWWRHPFAAAPDAAKAGDDDRELPRRWALALADALEHDLWAAGAAPRHPWDSFAAGRLRGAFAPAALAERPPARTDLTRLMDTTTGVLSIQEALQHDRGLRVRVGDEPRVIPIAELSGPPLDAHPFAAMQAELPRPDGGAAEPLAAAAPADFWYARVDGIPLLFRLLDEADAWITPLTHILQQNPEDRHLVDTYQGQLGLERGELARILGAAVVGHVALVGSDPYLRQGSDLTAIFQVREPTLFDAELDRHLRQRRDALEARGRRITEATVRRGDVTIRVIRDDAGDLRQHRARVGDLAVVSNSPRAIERVLDAIAGAAPRLADEPDLKYMLARDPGEHQGFAFLSDRFIAAAVGPAQKIQAARREVALAELLTPGYAALLYGWLHGQSPPSVDALLRAGLLAADELRHASGEPIRAAIEPIIADRMPPLRISASAWGSPDFLTPILDLPPVDRVSAAERDAYERFRATYQSYWKQFIDPVALRLDVRPAPDGVGDVAELDVRILPLISATDYRDLAEVVGDTRVHVDPHGGGLVAVWAVGAESRTRRELDGLIRAAAGKGDIGIGWLGDWVMLGVEDRAALVDLLSWLDDSVQLPSPRRRDRDLDDVELWRRIGRAPLYAAAEVRNPAALVATLSALRGLVNEVAPGMVEWGELRRYRDLPIVRVGIAESAPLLRDREVARAVGLHYVQTGAAIAVALDPGALERVIDRLLDGQVPKASKEGPAQFVVDARTAPGRALSTAALWLLQGQANAAQPSADRAAEILLRGAPEFRGPGGARLLGIGYLGASPLSSRGPVDFLLTPTGAADPQIGTRIAPVFRPLPHPGSPIEGLVSRLRAVRGEVSFDREPAAAGPDARSLHTRVTVALGRL